MFKQNFENIKIENKNGKILILSLQGPMARKILQGHVNVNLNKLPFFHFRDCLLKDFKCMISRTGYTGELGYAIFSETINSVYLWKTILNLGKPYNLKPVGLGCRDTLRMKMKYMLYGNDINDNVHPFEAGLSWIACLRKNNFVGKKSLMMLKNDLKKKLICLVMDERSIPRSGYPILKNGDQIGKNTSGR